MTDTDKFRCARCRVTFAIIKEHPNTGEHLKCSDCTLPFHAINKSNDTAMYVVKKDLENWYNG